MKSKTASSIFAEDILVIGAISSEGQVEIFGRVEGGVRAGSLTIGHDASVIGEVAAESVVVHGRIEGLVRARNVLLLSTASVQGYIVQARLAIQSGAEFDGQCRWEALPVPAEKDLHVRASTSDGVAEELDIPPCRRPSKVRSDERELSRSGRFRSLFR